MTFRIEPPKLSPRTSGLFLRWSAPVLLFLVGISALGYCGYVMLEAQFFQNNQSRQFDQAVRAANASAAVNPAATPPVMPVFVDANNVTPKFSAANVSENVPLGRMEIATIGLTAMIQEGTTSRILQRGVGHITGTALLGQPGNIGLAGHRDTFFRKLREIHEGDEITLTTLTGSFHYRVELISIVEPQDSQVLRDTGGDVLTLVTCYPFSFVGPAPKRFIVRAREIGRALPEPSVVEPPLHP